MADEMYAVSGETLTGIAEAIRSKTGSDDFMTVAAMASAIEGISSGVDGNTVSGIFTQTATGSQQTITITHNIGKIPKLFVLELSAKAPNATVLLYGAAIINIGTEACIRFRTDRGVVTYSDTITSGFNITPNHISFPTGNLWLSVNVPNYLYKIIF